MTRGDVEGRLRFFLLGLAVFLCAGTLIELWAADHTAEPAQIVPFVLSVAGLVATLFVMVRPSRLALRALRGVMAFNVLGGVVGIVLHVAGNFRLLLEIDPEASLGQVAIDALKGGNPLLAPGTLAVIGIIAFIATYRHPALRRQKVQ